MTTDQAKHLSETAIAKLMDALERGQSEALKLYLAVMSRFHRTQFVASQNIVLEYDSTIAPARGMSSGGKITLLPDLSPAEHLAVLAHELGHELLHRGDRRQATTHTIRETEAEAVAFVVSTAIGLEATTSSSDYIQLHAGDKATLAESLAFIQQTASVILQAIEPRETAAANPQLN